MKIKIVHNLVQHFHDRGLEIFIIHRLKALKEFFIQSRRLRTFKDFQMYKTFKTFQHSIFDLRHSIYIRAVSSYKNHWSILVKVNYFQNVFWCLQFSQKMNEKNSAWHTIVVKSNCFVHFFGELEICTKKRIRN